MSIIANIIGIIILCGVSVMGIVMFGLLGLVFLQLLLVAVGVFFEILSSMFSPLFNLVPKFKKKSTKIERPNIKG